MISELSSSRSRKRLVACVAGFKTLEFICAVVVAETKVDLAVEVALLRELFRRFLARANKEAQPDLCERHFARAANREAQLDLLWLRHLARAANREAQLDSFWLRHLVRAANREAQLDSCDVGWELSEAAIA